MTDTLTVASTEDYTVFKTLTSNRPIIQSHVKKLAKSMKENPHLFASRPILVNENMFVIDGQHRLRAAKEVGAPVYFMVSENITVDDTRLLNTTQTNWSMIDFARSYASTGNEYYQQYLSALSKYPNLTPTIIRYVLGGGITHGETSVFKSGAFTIDQPEIADVYLEQMSYIQHLVPSVRINRAIGNALLQLFDKPDVFNYDHFIEQLESDGGAQLFRPADKLKDAMRSIEDVYNYRKYEKNRVRFY
jgi:hypothetical protein